MGRHEIGDYALIESRDDGTVVIEHTPTGESIQLDSAGMRAGAGAFDSVDTPTLTATNGDISALGLDSLTHGDNPAETITENTSPKSFTFSAGDNRDIHDATDVTISNASGASATEDITVSLYEGVDTTGTLLVNETRSITVADATTVSETFIADNVGLGAGDYHIEITQSGTALSIDETTEYTLGAEFTTTDQADDGTLVTTDQQGRERVRHDPVDNRAEFPGAIESSEAFITRLLADDAEIGDAPLDGLTYDVPLAVRGGTDSRGMILRNVDDTQANGTGKANLDWVSDSGERLANIVAHPTDNHLSFYLNDDVFGNGSLTTLKRLDLEGGPGDQPAFFQNNSVLEVSSAAGPAKIRLSPPANESSQFEFYEGDNVKWWVQYRDTQNRVRWYNWTTGNTVWALTDGDAIDHTQSTSQNVVWESGTTAGRPGTPVAGQRYFDTDLGKPIWFNGTDWVDAQGTIV